MKISFIDIPETIKSIQENEETVNLIDSMTSSPTLDEKAGKELITILCTEIAEFTGKIYYDECIEQIITKLDCFEKVKPFWENTILREEAVQAGRINCNSITPDIKYIPLSFVIEGKNGKRSLDKDSFIEYMIETFPIKLVELKKAGMNCDYQIYEFQESKYVPLDQTVLGGKIKNLLNKSGIFNSTTSLIKEIINSLMMTMSFNGMTIQMSEFNCRENLVNTLSGVLEITGKGDLILHDHSPDYLFTYVIPCNYSETATSPVRWEKYLSELSSDDEEMKNFLYQYAGAVFSNINGYRFKKALFLEGEGNSGKSVYMSSVQKILGGDNCSSIELKELEERFGTAPLFGKRLAGSADMKSAKINTLNVFKKVTGGDTIDIEIKCKPKFDYKYTGFLLFCCNKVPLFGGDKGDWVYDRMIILPCNNIIPEDKRDPKLVEKLYSERDAFFNKAIRAFAEVVANGYRFDIPSISKSSKEALRRRNDNAIVFADECLEPWEISGEAKRKSHASVTVIYEVYIAWCKALHTTPLSYDEFKTSMRQHAKSKPGETGLTEVNGKTYFKAYNLKLSAKERFIDAYGPAFVAGERSRSKVTAEVDEGNTDIAI